MADTPNIPVSRETIQSHGEPPSLTSSLYLHRSKHIRTDGVEQNVVAGVHIVFKRGDANNLYESFHTSRDQKLDAGPSPGPKKALLIACDTLEISGMLSLPEWDVAIFARKLIFQDKGSLDTTPLNWALEKAADYDPNSRKGGTSGSEGHDAGAISVFVDAMEAPAGESMQRFVCRGGNGQHAGHGKDGADGKNRDTISAVFQAKEATSGHLNTFTASFANPCVFAKYHWHWGWELSRDERGVNDWPGNGGDALEPGAPGSGGNGGAWVSNQAAFAALVDTTEGKAGHSADGVRGGSAGWPTTSTHYDLTIRFDLVKDTAQGDSDLTETRTTTAGKGYETKKKPRKEKADAGAKKTIDAANAWVHPFQLESVLRYARDAFLAGVRDPVANLLKPYEHALNLPLPAVSDTGLPWVAGEAAAWTAAQAEVAGMLHRLRNQLDYFGNPAGYMPFLSLQATLRLYDIETKDAVRTLLLASWVQDVSNQKQSSANAIGSALDELNKDTARVAEQLVQAEAKMESLDQQMGSLEQRLDTLAKDLGKLRNELYSEASNNEHTKALIKGGIKIAAAICQVVPVGQPVLGTLGDLANIAADIDVEGVPDTVTKIGGTIKKARDAANKAKKAKEEAKKKEKEPKDKEAAKKKASAWEIAGNGFGPALSIAGEAIGAMQVSDEQIEVELAKLSAANPKWKALTDQIRALNKDKSRLFTELSSVLQALGDGYARLAGNAASVVTMHQERADTLAKLSLEANQVIAKMGQTARLSLQRSLYLMVKSYETTVFKPIDVDWNLDLVFDKIRELLKPETGFDAASINEFAKTIAPAFETNRRKIKESLLADYDFPHMGSAPLEFGFAANATEALDTLRSGRRLILDPLVCGLIVPTQERAKALGFECTKLAFSTKGPALPTSGNAIISLRTGGDGTIRRGERLYAVRSDAPRVWSWIHHFSDGSRQARVPSLSTLDLLNMLLESDDNEIKQKLAAPPAWSELTIDVEFSPPIAPDLRPKIESLVFACTVESVPAPGSQKVLDIRGASISECVSIAPADLAGRSYGFGDIYRIYGNAATVKLKAPAALGDRPFSHWDVVSSESSRTERKAEIDIRLDSNTLTYCRYKSEYQTSFTLRDHVGGKDVEEIERVVGSKEQALAVKELLANAGPPALQAPRQALLIHAGPAAGQPVIGLLPEGESPTVLEESGGWGKVAFEGLVGYVAVAARAGAS
jgi:hypothetical protein